MKNPWVKAWIGVYGGAAAWYGAHDLSLYLVNDNCRQVWIAPLIHLIGLAAAIGAGFVAWRVMPREDPESDANRLMTFSCGLSIGAAALFSLVILWQGIATLIYSGCER